MTDYETEIPAPAIVRSVARREKSEDYAPAPQTATAPPVARRKTRKVEMKTRAQTVEATTQQPNESMLMGCPACGSRISKRAHSCPKCGTAPYRPCMICASQILSNATPCPECGDPQPFEAA